MPSPLWLLPAWWHSHQLQSPSFACRWEKRLGERKGSAQGLPAASDGAELRGHGPGSFHTVLRTTSMAWGRLPHQVLPTYWAPCSVLHPGDATDSCLQPSSGMEAWPGVAAGALACEWPRLLPPGRREEPDASPSQRGNPQFREEIWEETKGAPALWRRHCEMSTHWCGEGEASTHFCP